MKYDFILGSGDFANINHTTADDAIHEFSSTEEMIFESLKKLTESESNEEMDAQKNVAKII